MRLSLHLLTFDEEFVPFEVERFDDLKPSLNKAASIYKPWVKRLYASRQVWHCILQKSRCTSAPGQHLPNRSQVLGLGRNAERDLTQQHPQHSHHLLLIPFRLPTESVGTAGQCGLVLKLEECFSRSQEVIMTRTPDRSRGNGGSNRCRHLWPAWELMSTLTS